jgi:RHS repeat-associated protein
MKPLQPIPPCHYRYDALDRLIGHAPLGEPELQRFYCKSRLTTEIQGAMKHSIVQYGDVLLAQQRYEEDALKTSLLATDQQRSVMQTLNADHLPKPLAYSPYGHRPPENGMLSLLGFNGERPDPVTGHYLLGNGYRAFNPVLMRFNSPDSLSPFGKGGLNPYTYCLGDPTNNYDPDGHRTLPLSWVINLRVLAKKASANVLKIKGTIPTHRTNTGHLISKPIPGITAENAVNQRSIVEKTYRLESTPHIQNQKFNQDLRIAKASDLTDPTMKTRLDMLSDIQKDSSHITSWSDTLDYEKLRARTGSRQIDMAKAYYAEELWDHTLRTQKEPASIKSMAAAQQRDEAYFIRTS